MYTLEQAEKLKGKLVKCDDLECDGSPCKYAHNKPHIYDDEECFAECGHIDCSGLCVPIEPEHVGQLKLDN